MNTMYIIDYEQLVFVDINAFCYRIRQAILSNPTLSNLVVEHDNFVEKSVQELVKGFIQQRLKGDLRIEDFQAAVCKAIGLSNEPEIFNACWQQAYAIKLKTMQQLSDISKKQQLLNFELIVACTEQEIQSEECQNIKQQLASECSDLRIKFSTQDENIDEEEIPVKGLSKVKDPLDYILQDCEVIRPEIPVKIMCGDAFLSAWNSLAKNNALIAQKEVKHTFQKVGDYFQYVGAVMTQSMGINSYNLVEDYNMALEQSTVDNKKTLK